MDANAAAGSRELADYLMMLRRRWWVVAAAAALGVALGALMVAVMPKTYTAFAVVNVSPTKSDAGSQSGRNQDINMQTESQRVRSFTVANRVAQSLRSGEAPSDLIASVQVDAPNDSTVLYINVTADGAKQARDRAHAFAQSYLDERRDQATQALMNQLTALEKQSASLAKRLESLTDRVQKQLVIGQMQVLNNRTSDIRVSAANINPGEIITDARIPSAPSDPSLSRYLPSGLVAGLLLGVVCAVLMDRFDRRVRTAEDLERKLDMPVLLDVPQSRGKEGIGLLPARSRTGQSFHELAHALTATLGHGNHVLLVTGASTGKGPSIVAANLAAALARTGSEVMLVSANLQESIAGELLGLRRGPGLAEVLLGRAEAAKVTQRNHALPTLRAITSGTDVEMAAEMLQREQMTQLIEGLRGRSRYLVLEAPSTGEGADAQALADLADAAIVVVEVPRTRYDQIRDGVRRIHRMGAAVMGAVVLPSQDGKTVVAQAPALPAHGERLAGGAPRSRPGRPTGTPANGNGAAYAATGYEREAAPAGSADQAEHRSGRHAGSGRRERVHEPAAEESTMTMAKITEDAAPPVPAKPAVPAPSPAEEDDLSPLDTVNDKNSAKVRWEG